MKRQWAFCVLSAVLSALFLGAGAEAAKLDAYRTVIEQKAFTLEYENEAPEIIKGNTTSSYVDCLYSRTPFRGKVVMNGEDKFAEADFHMDQVNSESVLDDKDYLGFYYLKKNGEKFFYISAYVGARYKTTEYMAYGMEMGKIKANYWFGGHEEAMKIEAMLCHPIIGNLIQAICPNDNIPAAYALPSFTLADEGTLDGGLFYEDYTAERDGVFYAMRCYFDGDTLVKASFASYGKSVDGSPDPASYKISTVKIKAFSSVPDASCFQLPKGLKDITKRDKKGKGDRE